MINGYQRASQATPRAVQADDEKPKRLNRVAICCIEHYCSWWCTYPTAVIGAGSIYACFNGCTSGCLLTQLAYAPFGVMGYSIAAISALCFPDMFKDMPTSWLCHRYIVSEEKCGCCFEGGCSFDD